MPFENPLAAEGNPDALRHVESFHAPPDNIASNLHAQLTNPQDIASANQFFKPAGTNQFLPTVGNVGPHGIEMSAVTPVGKFAVPPMTGLETHGLQLPPPGGEMAALSGAPGAVMPGAEQISPLINMIMKMPGHIGLVSSFFEALGAFFAPAQEMLGHLAAGFDAGALFEHAGSASEALSGAMESISDHISVDLNLLPADAPIFDQIGHGAAAGDLGSGLESSGLGLGAPHLSDSFSAAPRLEVGSGPNHPMFEMGPDAHNLHFDVPNNNYLAIEPNHGFGATVGNFNPPAGAPPPLPQAHTLQTTAPAPTSPTTSAAPTTASAQGAPPATHTGQPSSWHRDILSSSRSHLMGDTTGGAGHSAEAHTAAHPAEMHQAHHTSEADHGAENLTDRATDRTTEVSDGARGESSSYTVHKGDNLWDIAREHLGDGSRWEEIYDLNKSLLGDNPRMIMPGTELQLPGADLVDSGNIGGVGGGGDYTVQSGDSLWNISHEHLGGGQNWHELYQGNEAVIGSNPSMIHPGQHLHLDASAHGHALGGPAAAGDHNLASGSSHGHHLANHPQGPVHSHNATHAGAGHHPHTENSVAQARQPGSTNTAAAAHHVAQANPAHPTAAAAAAATPTNSTIGGELKAQARSLSSIQSYGDVTHAIDSATHVPNSQP